MPETKSRGDKYGGHEATVTARAFHQLTRALVDVKLAEAGGDWNSFVFDRSYELVTARDLAQVEADFLARTGHRFEPSATISVKESPDKYRPIALVEPARPSEVNREKRDGKQLVGEGDNVVRHAENTVGVARFIRNSEIVLDMLLNGVPDSTIAIIDDSGGTLTAPILEQFKGVICFGGTVRSHLGILTREYGIPCLMNAKVEGVGEGDRVEIEVSATAKTAQDYQAGRTATARIWKLG